jgi:hypothetical protein
MPLGQFRVGGATIFEAQMMTAVDVKPVATRSDPEARRAYSRWHYRQNKPAYKARARLKTTAMRDEARAFVLAYLREHPCIDCGESDPIVLELDHRPGDKKCFEIGNVISRGYSVATIEAEIKKCDVRCANCHRRITYRRAGFRNRG